MTRHGKKTEKKYQGQISDMFHSGFNLWSPYNPQGDLAMRGQMACLSSLAVK
jgi:hypothetical protein